MPPARPRPIEERVATLEEAGRSMAAALDRVAAGLEVHVRDCGRGHVEMAERLARGDATMRENGRLAQEALKGVETANRGIAELTDFVKKDRAASTAVEQRAIEARVRAEVEAEAARELAEQRRQLGNARLRNWVLTASLAAAVALSTWLLKREVAQIDAALILLRDLVNEKKLEELR
ncbi:hypothetical protein [Minwuia thermotolerans]|uniref:Uncharacterized protein n=1 Tax=Minwuia thermotolerans TaxID=2056226 RepID=A0A2M9G2Q5_9PROT|nr:hypothetical protein [Minwuia thermotolerans]PJK29974.1 hypothetical protein CVT23_09410 [Minwuia thermotolerans]